MRPLTSPAEDSATRRRSPEQANWNDSLRRESLKRLTAAELQHAADSIGAALRTECLLARRELKRFMDGH